MDRLTKRGESPFFSLPAEEKFPIYKYKEKEFKMIKINFFTIEIAQNIVDELKTRLIFPYINCYVSTLGGQDRPTIMLTVSLDKKENWANGILQNSKYANFHIDYMGKVEYFSGRLTNKVRKFNAKNIDNLIKKLNEIN
jgi:hypothetical protein